MIDKNLLRLLGDNKKYIFYTVPTISFAALKFHVRFVYFCVIIIDENLYFNCYLNLYSKFILKRKFLQDFSQA